MTDIKADTPSPTTEPKRDAIAVLDPDATVGFDSAAGFALLQRGAALLSASTLVPQRYQGNLPNCVIALNMAARIKADPLMVMQNLYIVHGSPGWSAKFLIATFNQCGRFSAIRYEWAGAQADGDAWGCRAKAIEFKTGEELKGSLISVGLAKAEGWWNKPTQSGQNASKWPTMTEQMLMYRSAAWFINTHAPEIAMGLPTTEEIEDRGIIDVTPGPPRGPVVVTPETLVGGIKAADVVAGVASGVEGAEPQAGATADADVPAAPGEIDVLLAAITAQAEARAVKPAVLLHLYRKHLNVGGVDQIAHTAASATGLGKVLAEIRAIQKRP